VVNVCNDGDVADIHEQKMTRAESVEVYPESSKKQENSDVFELQKPC
jgi:hypothetical protein